MVGAAGFIAVLLGLQLARAKVNTKFLIKNTTSCPDAGYFISREVSPNAVHHEDCYLCFCKGVGQAVCWWRGSRCDERYPHRVLGRNAIGRYKRSIGLSDLFFKDATLNFFKKNLDANCEPHKGSYSEGCPPADWCEGCTVCDCNENGHWDCHVLSFCNEDERKKHAHKKSISKTKIKNYKNKSTKKPIKTRKTNKKTTRKPNTTKRLMKKTKLNKNLKEKTSLRNKKQKQRNKTKRNTGNIREKTHKIPKNMPQKLKKIMADNNIDEAELGQMFVKRVMTTVNKMINKELERYNISKLSTADCRRAKLKAEQEKTKRHVRVMKMRAKREALDFSSVKLRNNTTSYPKDFNDVIPLERTDTKQTNNTTPPSYLIYNVYKTNQPEQNQTKKFIIEVDYEDITTIKNENTTNNNSVESTVSPQSVTQMQKPTKFDNVSIIDKVLKVNGRNIFKMVTKKQNRTIFVNILKKTTPSYKVKNKDAIKITNTTNFTNVLYNITKNLNKQNKKKNNYNFLRKLRKLFNQMFDSKKNKKYKKIKDEYQTLKILCNNMNSCNIDENNRHIIRLKLKSLNNQSDIIFKTLKIIKGLLRLIETHHVGNKTDKNCWKADIQKLNAIIRDDYKNKDGTPLTDTQIAQANLIKQNTEVFIETAARFTKALHDIINNLNADKNLNRQIRFANVTDSFLNVKSLLVKHNLTKSKHMNDIYEEISNIENSIDGEKGQNFRRKRQLQPPVDYMFTLMEYLMKNQNPSAMYFGQKDGIDLLIDAIRNAPDIHTIKKLGSTKLTKNPIESDSKIDSFDSFSISNENTRLNELQRNQFKIGPYNINDEFSHIVVINEIPDENKKLNNPIQPLFNSSEEKDTFINDTSDLNDIDSIDSKHISKENTTYNYVIKSNQSKILKFKSFNDTVPFLIANDLTTKSNKAKTDWSIENFGKDNDSTSNSNEIKTNLLEAISKESNEKADYNDNSTDVSVTTDTSIKTDKIQNNVDKIDENKISSTDVVLRRKQLNLLNSLDYETEKPDYEDMESRDDEKFNYPY